MTLMKNTHRSQSILNLLILKTTTCSETLGVRAWPMLMRCLMIKLFKKCRNNKHIEVHSLERLTGSHLKCYMTVYLDLSLIYGP